MEKIKRLISKEKYEEALKILQDDQSDKMDSNEASYFKIQILREKSENSEALQSAEVLFTKLENQVPEKILLKFDVILEIGRILLNLSRFDDVNPWIKEGETLLKLCAESANEVKFRKAQLIFLKSALYFCMGDYEKAHQKTLISLEYAREFDDLKFIGDVYSRLSAIYILKGDLDNGLKVSKKALKIRKELGNRKDISNIINNLGVIAIQTGNQEQALQYYQECLEIRKDIDDRIGIANVMDNIGQIYVGRAEYQQALIFYQKSFQMQLETGDKLNLSISYENLGELYQILGNLEEARSYYNLALDIRLEMNIPYYVITSFYEMISICILTHEITTVNKYFHQMEKYYENNKDNKRISTTFHLTKAMILNISSRLRDKFKAQELFTKIAYKETIDFEIRVTAMLNLANCLLNELKLDENAEIVIELNNLLQKLVDLADGENSYLILCETYWLQAQVALIELDLTKARILLTKAQKIADNKGLIQLAQRISDEHDKFLDQINQWEDLIQKDSSIIERVKIAGIEELILQMNKQKKVEAIKKEPEAPIFLIILTSSGFPAYSKNFSNQMILNDQLISGFFTAINSFVQEAFQVTGSIKRIKHDKNTVIFSKLDHLLFAYIFQGQSYFADQKLDQLVLKLQNSSIWQKLLEVQTRGVHLTFEESKLIENWVMKLF